MGKNRDIEGPIHRSILDYLRTQYPSAVIHHSPNEFAGSGPMIAKEKAKHKKNGMLNGFPDLVMFYAGKSFCFEVKSPKGRLSDSQIDVGASLQAHGVHWSMVRSIDDVERFMTECDVFPGRGDNFTTVGKG